MMRRKALFNGASFFSGAGEGSERGLSREAYRAGEHGSHRYIEALWQGEDTELMVIKNTRIFIEKFEKAAKKLKLSYAHGKVHYDLDEKLSDIKYYDLAMKDSFESVFHKVKEGYEIQNEVRFAIINPDKPEHMELMLEKDLKLRFTLIPLRYGKDILIELSDLEFDDKLNLPIRFSSEIKYYESER